MSIRSALNLASITGQSRDMVEHYAKRVNQKKLARAAMARWEGSEYCEGEEREQNRCFSTPARVSGLFAT